MKSSTFGLGKRWERFELLHLLFLENFLQLQNFFSKQRFVLVSFSAFMTHTDFSCDIYGTDLAQN